MFNPRSLLHGYRRVRARHYSCSQNNPSAGAGAPSTQVAGQDAGKGPGAGENPRIVYGEIIGWRSWHVRGDTLWPLAVPNCVPWKSGTNECLWYGIPEAPYPYNGLPIPRADNGIGFYAKKKRRLLLGGPTIVTGRVALWGQVALHRDGYRGQYARVVSLDYGLTRTERKRLAKTYGATAGGSWSPSFETWHKTALCLLMLCLLALEVSCIARGRYIFATINGANFAVQVVLYWRWYIRRRGPSPQPVP